MVSRDVPDSCPPTVSPVMLPPQDTSGLNYSPRRAADPEGPSSPLNFLLNHSTPRDTGSVFLPPELLCQPEFLGRGDSDL